MQVTRKCVLSWQAANEDRSRPNQILTYVNEKQWQFIFFQKKYLWSFYFDLVIFARYICTRVKKNTTSHFVHKQFTCRHRERRYKSSEEDYTVTCIDLLKQQLKK